MKFLTGFPKFIIYAKIALHVAIKYMFKMNPLRYIIFLRRATILLLNFRHNKVVKVEQGYKLQLYLPAYPTKAFFRTIESKLIHKPARPATVVYSITKACNYKCPHCYQHNDKGTDITEDKLIETALKIQNTGVTMFDIEGGETFLKFDRLTALLTALNNGVETWVNTHGGACDKKKLKTLKDLSLFGLMVSIHSHNAQEHDKFTGINGSFNAACETVRLCSEMNLTVALNSVLTKEQIDSGELDKLMELALQLNCDFVQLIHPKPAGKWIRSMEQIKHEKRTIKTVIKKHNQYNSRKYKKYPVLTAQVFEERKESLGCTAGGIDRFYINATGEVQPCEFLNISFGNINEETFELIFSRMRSFFKKPCIDWLCCTTSSQIADMLKKNNLNSTPLPWTYTKELVQNWDRGAPTKLYKKLGIYK